MSNVMPVILYIRDFKGFAYLWGAHFSYIVGNKLLEFSVLNSDHKHSISSIHLIK